MKKKVTFLLSFLCVLFATAQETLSLSDAIQLGLQRNYDILIEQSNVEIASNNNSSGEAGRWPTISLSVSNNNSLTNNVRTAFPTATQGKTIVNNLTPGVNVNWMIFDGFKVNINQRRLEMLQAETEGNASIVISNTIQAIVLGYYLSALESERLNELRKQLDLSKDRFEYIKIKSDLGGAVSSDVLLEEGNYLTDSLNYINQELQLRNAQRNLNLLIQEPIETKTYLLTDTLRIPMGEYSISDLQSRMLGDNVDIKKQYITQRILGTGTGLARADRFPNLSLTAGYSDNRNSLDLSNASFFTGSGFANGPNDRLNSVTDNYFVNFSLSYTLFNGGKIKRAIKNALINENIGEIRTDQLEASLKRDLVEALDRYNVRKQLYGINQKREEAARINLQLSQDKFKNGSINSFDYRTVQNNHLSAAILKLQAIYNLIDSEIELMRLTGGLIRDYK